MREIILLKQPSGQTSIKTNEEKQKREYMDY